MADPLRHRQTKGAATDMVDLTPPRHISTLPWLAFYNEERQHQSHGYRTPRQVYEAQAGGYVDDRLCRPAALPPLPEPARKAGKCSPSPTSPPAQPPTQGLIKRVLTVE